ncbi:DUF3291 domain-containing protein [Gymnodinialimonas sp.]
MSGDTHIAHLNWATLRAPIGDPLVEPFVSAVPKVNPLAERSPGFVWRQVDEGAVARAAGWTIFEENPRLIASFSVWESVEHLRAFVYQTVHGAFFKRGDAWFEPSENRGHVLWPVPAGQLPSMAEARSRYEAQIAGAPLPGTFSLTVPA